ncbi:hypothetical protein QT381_06090 [Galbitalea sp. SE-J8]|uniref:hypothetical protein n=1 Tax=Galbitalea sp. SE-J8 TaxID=3054952 RepID=UPI00259C6DDC|nr:hypothetical protein [Galbitalea sp. SE-J8]MDM4762572.1 hypothetical protein [Galbitalea sp. SE-J8]
MALLLLLYLVFAIYYGTVFLRVGTPVAVGIGVALLVLPLLGLWALVAELRFGIRTERLARRLDAEGGLPAALPARASGRPEREAADAAFGAFRDDAEQHPDSWRAWYRLGLAYDASGDRRRARWATREALRLSRTDPTSR